MGYKVILLTEETENELDYSYPVAVKRVLIPRSSNLKKRLTVLQEVCRRESVDIYINHNWENDSVLWECLVLKELHIPFVQYVHCCFVWSLWRNKVTLCQPELFKICDLVLSLSETNARFYQLCGCDSYLVQNPIPEDLIGEDVNSLSETKHILLVGRLSAEKHPMEALGIFNLVHERISDVILDVVGADDANFIQRMQAFVYQNDLQNSVIFHGPKAQSEVAEFYKNTACVLYTSEMEGYPMVILETKAYGIPLVMYELPYLSLVKDGKGILTAPVGNMRVMSEHIIKILSDSCYRKQLGREARESFEKFCSYDIENAWSAIISICSGEKNTVDDMAYFNPHELSYADRFIEPMLIDSVKKGYRLILDTSIDYQLGRKLLRIPRKVKRKLLQMKGVIFHGEKKN